MININTAHTGLLNACFMDYDPDLNAWLPYYSTRHTVELKDVPNVFFDALAHHPGTMLTEKASVRVTVIAGWGDL